VKKSINGNKKVEKIFGSLKEVSTFALPNGESGNKRVTKSS
jgi:hypothetical protein